MLPKPMKMPGIRRIFSPPAFIASVRIMAATQSATTGAKSPAPPVGSSSVGAVRNGTMNAIRAATAATQDHQFMIVSSALRSSGFLLWGWTIPPRELNPTTSGSQLSMVLYVSQPYRANLSCSVKFLDFIKSGGEGETRTPTPFGHMILSHARLPIPALSHNGTSTMVLLLRRHRQCGVEGSPETNLRTSAQLHHNPQPSYSCGCKVIGVVRVKATRFFDSASLRSE